MSSPSGSTTVTRKTFQVEGKVTPATSDVTVNGESVTPDSDGSFYALEVLDPGENEVEIVAENGSKRTEYSRVVTRKLTAEEIAAKEAAEEAARKAAEEEAARRASKYATIGETVRVGDVEWTVTNARYTETLTAEFASPKSGNFVVVDFNFTNLGDEAVTLSTISLPLVDSQGREYEADTDSFMYVPLQKTSSWNRSTPGSPSRVRSSTRSHQTPLASPCKPEIWHSSRARQPA